MIDGRHQKINRMLAGWLALSIFTCCAACAAAEPFTKQSFNSQVEKSSSFFAVAPPAVKVAQPLLMVYMHGMGGDCTEPFNFPADQTIAAAITGKYKNAVFMSCHTGKAGWDSDAALADITSNIRQVNSQYAPGKIILIGSSMGGCTALTYAAVAPRDIKEKITGVIAVEAAGDLSALYDATAVAQVRDTLSAALGGTPAEVPANYRHKSFLRNLPTLDRNIKIFVVSAKQDTTVPSHFQKDIITALKNRDIPNRLVEVVAGHGIPPASIYLEGLKFITEESKEALPARADFVKTSQ